MEVYNIGEARTQLTKLVEMALSGKEIIIGKRNKPLVRLSPVEKSKQAKRKGGYLKGKIHIAPDFDEPFKEIEDLFYGRSS